MVSFFLMNPGSMLTLAIISGEREGQYFLSTQVLGPLGREPVGLKLAFSLYASIRGMSNDIAQKNVNANAKAITVAKTLFVSSRKKKRRLMVENNESN